jgi:hydroxymethylglutaryl-CoA lyase
MKTGVDLDKLIETGAWLAKQLGKPTSSRVTRARMGE